MKDTFRFWRRGAVAAAAVCGWLVSAHAQAPGQPPVEEEDEFVDEYATSGADVSDPFQRVNRTLFKFNNSVYDRVLRPFSRGYEAVVPAPGRRGLRSFFNNVRFPVRFANCVLQGKFNRAAAETGKFALNTTVGLAGFIKVSDRYGRLRVPEEDFGQTLGAWGIGPGPFLVLPVLGPSSLRDGVGRIGDYYATPTNWKFMDRYDSWVRTTIQVVDAVSGLPGVLATFDALRRSAVDPYVAFRNAYLQYREGEVKK
jgi:phospholipid-binding lipoprotein MlaA